MIANFLDVSVSIFFFGRKLAKWELLFFQMSEFLLFLDMFYRQISKKNPNFLKKSPDYILSYNCR
jgi:hypothetical protein